MKLNDYIAGRKVRDRLFAEGYEEGRSLFLIGQAAHLARTDAGLSQKELAARAKVSVWMVSKLEKKPESVPLGAVSAVLSCLRPWLTPYGIQADHPVFSVSVSDAALTASSRPPPRVAPRRVHAVR